MAEQQKPEKGKKSNKKRAVAIFGVFAKHNFYTNGLTPEELRMRSTVNSETSRWGPHPLRRPITAC